MGYRIRTRAGDIAEVKDPAGDEVRDTSGVLKGVWATYPEGNQRHVPAGEFTRLARTREEQAANPGSELF